MQSWLIALGLRFATPDEERLFLIHFLENKIAHTRAYMIAASGVYYAFFLWDLLLDPVSLSTTIGIRTFVVVLWMLPLAGATLKRGAQRHSEGILLLFTIVPVWSLSLIYSHLQDGYDHGTAGTILLILYVATLLPMRAMIFTAFSVATWIGFISGEIIWVNQPTAHYIVNNISVGTALLLSLYSVAAREVAARQQFRTAVELSAAKAASDAALADLKSAQTRLVHAEKQASLGQLVAGVAHEINTPIGMAITAATTLEADIQQISRNAETGQLRRSELTNILARLKEGTSILFNNLNRAADLINDFRRIAVNQSSDKKQIIRLKEWLKEILSTLEPVIQRQGHALEIQCPADLVVETYPSALAQIVSHLIMNASLHGFGPNERGKISITIRQENFGVRILFHDDGKGIAPENLKKVFDPFFTTRRHEGDTGLGLHIVHNLVVGALEGEIELLSEIGLGTTVSIFLRSHSLSPPRRRHLNAA